MEFEIYLLPKKKMAQTTPAFRNSHGASHAWGPCALKPYPRNACSAVPKMARTAQAFRNSHGPPSPRASIPCALGPFQRNAKLTRAFARATACLGAVWAQPRHSLETMWESSKQFMDPVGNTIWDTCGNVPNLLPTNFRTLGVQSVANMGPVWGHLWIAKTEHSS